MFKPVFIRPGERKYGWGVTLTDYVTLDGGWLYGLKFNKYKISKISHLFCLSSLFLKLRKISIIKCEKAFSGFPDVQALKVTTKTVAILQSHKIIMVGLRGLR